MSTPKELSRKSIEEIRKETKQLAEAQSAFYVKFHDAEKLKKMVEERKRIKEKQSSAP